MLHERITCCHLSDAEPRPSQRIHHVLGVQDVD